MEEGNLDVTEQGSKTERNAEWYCVCFRRAAQCWSIAYLVNVESDSFSSSIQKDRTSLFSEIMKA